MPNKQRREADGLTANERALAVATVKGATLAEAYDATDYTQNIKEEHKPMAAYKVKNRPRVAEAIARLQQAVDNKEILEISQIQAKLTELALDTNNSKNVQLKALDQLAKTKGAYTDNVNVHSSGALSIEDKRELARDVLSE